MEWGFRSEFNVNSHQIPTVATFYFTSLSYLEQHRSTSLLPISKLIICSVSVLCNFSCPLLLSLWFEGQST